MASMSPVMTEVSGLPSSSPVRTVVSRVLGKQFSNIQASSGVGDAFLGRLNFGLDGIVGKFAIRERWAAGCVGSGGTGGQGGSGKHGGLKEGTAGGHRIAIVEQCPAV